MSDLPREVEDAALYFEVWLGRMMIAWADAESELYRVLVAYSGVSTAVGRALFSGTRASAMMDLLKNIAVNTAMEGDRKSDLLSTFEQLKSINTMRDHLAHHTTDSYSYTHEWKRVVANMRSKQIGVNKGYEIDAAVLEAMTIDLYEIVNRLNMHHGPRTGPFTPWLMQPDTGVQAPWLYKPPSPLQNWESPP